MNAAGWFIMLVSLVLVCGVTGWSYYKLLRAPRAKTPPELPEARTLDDGPAK
ncbi:MAG TPA: hypothetical protein VNO33_11335 [Kofleriaceae bacterium]|nr:hypothetical protein [Kofleriaceae bacterium]